MSTLIGKCLKTSLLLSSLCFFIDHTQAQCTPVKTDFSSCTYTTVGHRGYSAVYPENTLLSIEEAFRRGVKYTECDVSLTKDDKYVLFHDESSVYRTTNGSGDIFDYTLAEIQLLDAGSWKGEQYKGTRIPTLIDALKLAEKYDAHLYLDLKSKDFNALKASLTEAGVAPNRFLPSISSIAEAQQFRAILPQTPWVWYQAGNYPADTNNASFYTQCVQLGCIAFEVSEELVGDANWETFKGNVHTAGAQIWVFTVNNNATFTSRVASGVDGMETDRSWDAARLICDDLKGNNGFDSLTTGNWHFASDLSATYMGSQIRPYKYKNTPSNQQPEFASCSVFSIPFIDSVNKVVMRVPAFDSANSLLVLPNFRIENSGIEDQSYSIIMDILLPAASANKWIGLFQTNTYNLNDADLFITPQGTIGISDSYHGQILPDKWYRVGFTVDGAAGQIQKYIDGVLVGTTPISGNRWSVWNSSRSGDDQGFLLFADNNGETAMMYMSALQTRNYVLTPEEMLVLGKASATGIKVGNADAWHANIDMAFSDSTFLDYENQTYYFVVPHNAPDSAILTFNTYAGATSSIANTKRINIANGSFSWSVTSGDGLQHKTWTACIRKTTTVTALSELEPVFTLNPVYPNPASSEITLTNLPDDQCDYTITDITGKQVLLNACNSVNPSISVSGLSNGLYFITVNHAEKVATTKFVIAK